MGQKRSKKRNDSIFHTIGIECSMVHHILWTASAILRICRDNIPMVQHIPDNAIILKCLKKSSISAGAIHIMGELCISAELLYFYS